MSKDITVVTQRGQTSIPAKIRKALSLTPGSQLLWERISDHEIRVALVRQQPKGARSVLGFARRYESATRSTAEWMAELRGGER